MKTLKIAISTVTTFFVLFLFTSSIFAQLEFVGNYQDGMGGAGWDADGSGPEPYGNGHGDIFYYTASRDYLDGEDNCGGKLTDVLDGFPAFEQALVDNGYSTEQVTLKFALANLGDDIEGIDYFSLGGIEYCNFYPVVITFELDGEPLVEATGNYGVYITGTNVRELESGFLKINNISSVGNNEVANAFMEDMGSEELQLKMTISPNNGPTFSENGRLGAYIDVTCTLEKGLPQIPFQSQYDSVVHEGLAGWDADGTGPEPFGDGHGTQLYYGASIDYDGIDPDPNACLAHFLEGQTGFLNTMLQLEYRGFEIDDLKIKLGLNSLGPDVEGEDWGNGWSNYYNNSIIIEVDGEPILSVLQDTNKLFSMGSYWSSITSIGKVYDISGNASSIAQFVAQSFLKDLGSHILKTNADEINYVYGADISGNGRDGATYKIDEGSIAGIHHEATFIPEGNVNGTWTVENSPYYIEGPITVENGQVLTIQPGVRVAVRGGYPVTVQGSVLAQGLEANPVMFTASNPNIFWDGFDYDYTPTGNVASVFDHCIFQYSKAQGEFPYNCGGVFAVRDYDGILLSNSTIRFNDASLNSNGYLGGGGAIALWNSSIQISHCEFYDNTSDYGAAVFCYLGSDAEISRNLFYNNQVETDAGALQIWSSNPTIVNNTFSLNHADNKGGAVDVYDFSDPTFINNIFWENSAINQGDQIAISSSNCDVSIVYCDVEGGEAGIGPYGISNGMYENNIDEDPLFIDLLTFDFQIPETSPCHNAGDPTIQDPDGTISDIGYCFALCTTGMEEPEQLVSGIKISPNPVTENSKIEFQLSNTEIVNIEIFSLSGKRIENIHNGEQPAGSYSIQFSTSSLKPGIYFCRLTTGSKVYTGKFVKK